MIVRYIRQSIRSAALIFTFVMIGVGAITNLNAQETQSAEPNTETQASDVPSDKSKVEKVDKKPAQMTPTKLILVVGAAGSDEFETQFEEWKDRWEKLSKSTDQFSMVTIHKTKSSKTPRAQLQEAIESTHESAESLWLVLLGHGTDDRKASKFNLVDLDVSATELNQWLNKIESPVVVVNCASSSGGFVSKLKNTINGRRRVVVASGKSGAQYNFARFGDFFSKAISNPDLDLDKDEQTSLLEAFIAASQQTQDYYKQENRLATELALIDDNGDGLGTPGDWFVGTRVEMKTKAGEVDGKLASKMILIRRGEEAKLKPEQRALRDSIEAKIEVLRDEKLDLDETAYYSRLEALMVELGEIYQ